MNEGKVFETNFKKSVPKDVFYLRLKDSASSFGQDSTATRFTLQNPYDMLMFDSENLYTFELKSTSGTSYSIQFDKSEKSKMIKKHQIDGLTQAGEYKNVKAGFIFDFRNSQTYFMFIQDFNTFISQTAKKSINEDDIIQHNGILIDKHKKIKNYSYDIAKLFVDIKERK